MEWQLSRESQVPRAVLYKKAHAHTKKKKEKRNTPATQNPTPSLPHLDLASAAILVLILLEHGSVPEYYSSDNALDLLLRPRPQQDPLGAAATLWPHVAGLLRRPQQVVDPVGVQHEGRVRDVVLTGSLREDGGLGGHGYYYCYYYFTPPRLPASPPPPLHFF